MNTQQRYSYVRFTCFCVAVFFLLTLTNANAQDVSNQTSVYIPDDLTVFIDGSITNDGLIQNKGTLVVTGDWQNTQVYQGDGKIVLQGDEDQKLFNNKQAIQNLVMQGTGNKVITDKVIVTQQLDLLQGIVFVGDADTLLLRDKAIVTVGSLSSYVDGALTAEGAGYKFFPIGKNGKYHPVEYMDVKGISPVIEVELFENLPAVTSPHASVYHNVYWTRKDIEGSFISSPVSFGYKFDNSTTQSHVIVAEGNDLQNEFAVVDNISIQDGDAMDKITTGQDLTGKILVLGESDPGFGNNILPKAFYISTSLSPLAENSENRVVKLFGDYLTDDNFHFQVYNRWGQQVYETSSLDAMQSTGWDGRQKNSGAALPTGTYPYLIKAVDVHGKAFEKQGVISIID